MRRRQPGTKSVARTSAGTPSAWWGPCTKGLVGVGLRLPRAIPQGALSWQGLLQDLQARPGGHLRPRRGRGLLPQLGLEPVSRVLSHTWVRGRPGVGRVGGASLTQHLDLPRSGQRGEGGDEEASVKS